MTTFTIEEVRLMILALRDVPRDMRGDLWHAQMNFLIIMRQIMTRHYAVQKVM